MKLGAAPSSQLLWGEWAPEGTHLSCSGFAGEASAGGETHYSSSSDKFICVVVEHFLALSVLAILIPGFDQVSGMRL